MQDGRFSTIKFNEWICVTAQYEKAVARLGKQVYQGYSRGLITDFTTLEMCKEISDTFAEAREIRSELEEELERDALDGLNVEETKQADEHRKLTQAQLTKRNLKLKFTKFMGRQAINRSLASQRDRVKELSRDLGLRALAVYKEEPVLKVRGHKALCRLAERLNDDADKRWQEIVSVNEETGGGLSFHTILINFVANFANFSKGTAVGKFLLKYFKYNEDEENAKLTQHYEGSSTADALKAQMEEIDEPHLDVGREIDNMQQEYEETPAEWGIPSGQSNEEAAAFVADQPDEDEFEEVTEKWEPESDTWDPDAAVDEDFLDVVADAPEFSVPDSDPEPFSPAPPPNPAGPTLLRRRPEPEAESWQDSANAPPAAPTLPRVGQAPAPSPAASSDDDWEWGDDSASDPWSDNKTETSQPDPKDDDPFGTAAMGLQEPGSGDPFASESSTAPTPPTPSAPAPSAPIAAEDEPDRRPPFVKPQEKEKPLGDWSAPQPAAQEKPLGDWSAPQPAAQEKPLGGWSAPQPAAQEKPLGDWSEPQPAAQEKPLGEWEQPAPQKPATSATDGWGLGSAGGTDEYGWGAASSTPSAQSKPTPPQAEPNTQAPAPKPAPPTPPPSSLQAEPAPSPPAPEPKPEPEPDISLGDDLLPAFLREKNDDDAAEDTSFIPELPSFLESDDAPQLEIVPFGSKEGMKAVDSEEDGGNEEPFIPQMPDL